MVLILTAAMAAVWLRYSDFLAQGQRPPEEAIKLNELEKSGLPAFTIKGLDGGDLNIQKFTGKIVILNFWASWCDPCIAEFPSLLKLVERFKGEVVLLAISADHEEADVHAFLKSFKVQSSNVYIAWDKDYVVAKQFGTSRLPESYIVGRDGRLIRKVAGVDDWSTKDAFEYFDHLLSL